MVKTKNIAVVGRSSTNNNKTIVSFHCTQNLLGTTSIAILRPVSLQSPDVEPLVANPENINKLILNFKT